MDAADKPGLTSLLQQTEKNKKVALEAESYLKFFDSRKDDHDLEEYRKANHVKMTNHYYDLITDFYEYGWGESFHFATLGRGESREHSFAKHEYRLALKLALQPGDVVLDMGCGIGGPARHIAKFSDAKIVGLNVNEYQLQRAEDLTKKAGLEHQCTFVKGNFLSAPFEEESFSKIYAIEATCHSPTLAQVYAEAFRLLKPGGLFACYEWIMTDKYDPTDSHHKKIKNDILEGDALPDLHSDKHVLDSLRQVGFEILEAEDLVPKSEVPWHSVLSARWTVSDFKLTPIGRMATHTVVAGMETVGLAPKGSTLVHKTLCKGADALYKGGKEGIFSPLYLFVVRKPLKS